MLDRLFDQLDELAESMGVIKVALALPGLSPPAQSYPPIPPGLPLCARAPDLATVCSPSVFPRLG